MSPRTQGGGEFTFYYNAEILRDAGRGHRQGTLLAKNAADAADIIHDMAANVWKRPLVKLEIYEYEENGTMDCVLTSTIGEGHARSLVAVDEGPKPKNINTGIVDDADDGDDDSYYDYMMLGYGSVAKKGDSSYNSFVCNDIGTYVSTAEVFPTMKLTDLEDK